MRTRVGSAPSLSILLTATRIGTSAALRVVDRLAGLRHDAVVGGDDDDRDVGHLGAAGAHGGERLVARRVEEGDRLVVVVDLVGADVLRDAAGLARGDLGLADRVQQRRLAVVDVAHDRDDRRALDEILVGVLEDDLVLGLVAGVDDLDLLAELLGQDRDRLVGERLREGDHLPHAHELLDDVGDGDAEVLGHVLTVEPELIRTRSVRLITSACSGAATSSSTSRRRRPRLRRPGRRPGGPPAAGRRGRPVRRDRRGRGARPASR